MFDHRQSGYILPDGLAVISTAFDKTIRARNIARDSDEADCLARKALHLYMNGTRSACELELRLNDACRQSSGWEQSSTLAGTQVMDVLPELSAWARSLTASPDEANALTERTLEYAIDHMAELIDTADLRGWLVRLMVDLRLGRGRRWQRAARL